MVDSLIGRSPIATRRETTDRFSMLCAGLVLLLWLRQGARCTAALLAAVSVLQGFGWIRRTRGRGAWFARAHVSVLRTVVPLCAVLLALRLAGTRERVAVEIGGAIGGLRIGHALYLPVASHRIALR